jgi:hypothetical protein
MQVTHAFQYTLDLQVSEFVGWLGIVDILSQNLLKGILLSHWVKVHGNKLI